MPLVNREGGMNDESESGDLPDAVRGSIPSHE